MSVDLSSCLFTYGEVGSGGYPRLSAGWCGFSFIMDSILDVLGCFCNKNQVNSAKFPHFQVFQSQKCTQRFSISGPYWPQPVGPYLNHLPDPIMLLHWQLSRVCLSRNMGALIENKSHLHGGRL